MRHRSTLKWGGALVVSSLAVACSLLMTPSRVRDGQLYQPGDPRYDAYFTDVHGLQADGATFGDDVRAARRPLVDELKLTMDSSESTISEVAHERIEAATSALGGGAKLEIEGDQVRFVTANGSRGDAETERLILALETDARAEVARAKRLNAVPVKADALLQTGHELQTHVADDFAKVGGQKPSEVRQELSASFDVVSTVSANAKRAAHDAEAFVADLQRAVAIGAAPTGEMAPPSTTPDAGVATTDASAPPAKSAATPTRPTAPSVYHPPPPPPPQPASTGEVFNP